MEPYIKRWFQLLTLDWIFLIICQSATITITIVLPKNLNLLRTRNRVKTDHTSLDTNTKKKRAQNLPMALQIGPNALASAVTPRPIPVIFPFSSSLPNVDTTVVKHCTTTDDA